MSDKQLKVYSLDYLKEKQYSDNTTEDATRLECAGRAVGMVDFLKEKHLLQLPPEDIAKLKSALFFALVGDTPVGDAYINDTLLVIDNQGNEYSAGTKINPPDQW